MICAQINDISIASENEIIFEDSIYLVVSEFPTFLNPDSIEKIYAINQFLRHVNELERICKTLKPIDSLVNQVEIVGSFKTLLLTDSLICFEFLVSNSISRKKYYRSVFINPKSLELVEPLKFPKSTETLLPWIDNYCNGHDITVNRFFYTKNLWQSTCYGITPFHLILYIGAEGEMFGYHRICIPMAQIIY